MMLTFEEHVKKFNLDEEEQEILAAYEAGKLKPDAESPKRIAELKKAAHETVKEIKARKAREATKMASFRLPVWVIEGLKRNAAKGGVKYSEYALEVLSKAAV